MALREEAGGQTGGEHAMARAVYGTLLCSALVAALDISQQPPHPLYDVIWLLITMTASALSHGYSDLLAAHPRPGERLRAARRTLIGEWPMLAAAAPSALVLLVAGLITAWPAGPAVSLALTLNVIALFGWGMASARNAGYRRAVSVLAGMADAALGALIIALNVLVK